MPVLRVLSVISLLPKGEPEKDHLLPESSGVHSPAPENLPVSLPAHAGRGPGRVGMGVLLVFPGPSWVKAACC